MQLDWTDKTQEIVEFLEVNNILSNCSIAYYINIRNKLSSAVNFIRAAEGDCKLETALSLKSNYGYLAGIILTSMAVRFVCPQINQTVLQFVGNPIKDKEKAISLLNLCILMIDIYIDKATYFDGD